eukprot:3073301-Amphidinium_carterae.1
MVLLGCVEEAEQPSQAAPSNGNKHESTVRLCMHSISTAGAAVTDRMKCWVFRATVAYIAVKEQVRAESCKSCERPSCRGLVSFPRVPQNAKLWWSSVWTKDVLRIQVGFHWHGVLKHIIDNGSLPAQARDRDRDRGRETKSKGESKGGSSHALT